MKDSLQVWASIIAIIAGIFTIIGWFQKGNNAKHFFRALFVISIIFLILLFAIPSETPNSDDGFTFFIATDTPMPQEGFSFEFAEPTILTSSPMNDETLGNWIIVIGGGYSSTEHAKSDLQANFSSYLNTAIFYRNSDIRTAIVGFYTQADAQHELESVKLIRDTAYLRELSVWCPTRDFYNDYIGCR